MPVLPPLIRRLFDTMIYSASAASKTNDYLTILTHDFPPHTLVPRSGMTLDDAAERLGRRLLLAALLSSPSPSAWPFSMSTSDNDNSTRASASLYVPLVLEGRVEIPGQGTLARRAF